MAYSVAIGGIVTDLVAYDSNNRRVVLTKTPTISGNFVVGVLDCFHETKLDPPTGSPFMRRPELRHLPCRDGPASSPGIRSVYFSGKGVVDSAVYQRASLSPGFAATDPAIEERGSTTWVWPDCFTIGAWRQIRVHCGKPGRIS